MHSEATQERVNAAMEHRKELRKAEGKDWKLYVKYPAILMVKKPGDAKYSKLAAF